MRIFSVTMAPISPPYDDGPKNIVMALAKKLPMHDYYFVSSRKRSFPHTANTIFIKSPFQRTGRHSMALFQKIYIFFLTVLYKSRMDLFQFFFTPQPYFSFIFRRLLKNKRSIQIVSSIHTLLEKNGEDAIGSLFFSDYVVVHSEYARQKLAEKNVKNIVKIYPAIEEERFNGVTAPDSCGEVRIVYPGTYKVLADAYSLGDFCKIALRVKDEVSNARFVMACRIRTREDSGLEKRFKSLVRECGLERSFTFLNTIDEMPSFLKGCSIGIMPARRPMSGILEIPLVLLELAILGKPVVYGNVPPLGELDSRGLGIMVSDDSCESYAKAIIKCVNDGGYASMVGERSRNAVRVDFTIDIAAGEYQRLYKVLQDKDE